VATLGRNTNSMFYHCATFFFLMYCKDHVVKNHHW
jgi:hypothetical protein